MGYVLSSMTHPQAMPVRLEEKKGRRTNRWNRLVFSFKSVARTKKKKEERKKNEPGERNLRSIF